MQDPEVPSSSILDEDMSGVDTSMPIIASPILHAFDIAKVEEVANSTKTGTNLKITLKTSAVLQDTKGNQIQPGWPCYTYIGLTETPKYNKDAIKRSCATFVEAVLGVKEKLNPLSRFEGKRVMCKVGIGKATEEYPDPGNTFRFVKA